MKHILCTAAIIGLTLSGCVVVSGNETSPIVSANMMNRVAAKTVTSQYSFFETETRLRDALGARNLDIFAVIDHGQGARSVEMDIGESKLFIFGNPKSGSALMSANPRFGFELPMKVLVFTDKEGRVQLSYTNIDALAETYDIRGKSSVIGKIEDTLDEIIDEAGGA